MSKRTTRSIKALPPDSPVWCWLDGEQPHFIGPAEGVTFYECSPCRGPEYPGNTLQLARCERHQALVRFLIQGNRLVSDE